MSDYQLSPSVRSANGASVPMMVSCAKWTPRRKPLMKSSRHLTSDKIDVLPDESVIWKFS